MLQGIFGPKGAFQSLTFWGVAGALLGTLVGHYDPNISPAVYQGMQLAGAVTAVLGLRRSNTKAIREIAGLVEDLAGKKQTPR